MLFFKRKRFDAKREKLRLIRRIEQLQARMPLHSLQRVTLALDRMVELLDDKYLCLRKEQIAFADAFLSDMDAHICKQYEGWLLKKCEHIAAMLRGECASDEQTITRIKNEDRLFEMLGELSSINEQIGSVDKKMEAALGKDKNLWNMLNSQRHTLTSRMLVINKNYQTLLESQNALSVATEVKKAREEAEAIMRQAGMQDVVEFEENAEFATMAAEDIRESTARMNEVFGRTFGGVADSYEYERALEQKLMTESNDSEPALKAPAVDRQD